MKDETAINSYELTLTPNYVSDWNFNDALRELIQNGTDQEVSGRFTTAKRKKSLQPKAEHFLLAVVI